MFENLYKNLQRKKNEDARIKESIQKAADNVPLGYEHVEYRGNCTSIMKDSLGDYDFER